MNIFTVAIMHKGRKMNPTSSFQSFTQSQLCRYELLSPIEQVFRQLGYCADSLWCSPRSKRSSTMGTNLRKPARCSADTPLSPLARLMLAPPCSIIWAIIIPYYLFLSVLCSVHQSTVGKDIESANKSWGWNVNNSFCYWKTGMETFFKFKSHAKSLAKQSLLSWLLNDISFAISSVLFFNILLEINNANIFIFFMILMMSHSKLTMCHSEWRCTHHADKQPYSLCTVGNDRHMKSSEVSAEQFVHRTTVTC